MSPSRENKERMVKNQGDEESIERESQRLALDLMVWVMPSPVREKELELYWERKSDVTGFRGGKKYSLSSSFQFYSIDNRLQI